MRIKDVLEHSWITNYDKDIKELRKKSQDMADKVMEFVAYSNISVDKVRENSPRSAENANVKFASLAGAAVVSN